MTRRLLLSTFTLLALGNCGPGASPCPDGGTALTYDNFGAAFMTKWCTRCHGAPLTEKGVVLTSAGSVRTFANQSNVQAGIGTSMPPLGDPAPTPGERAQLAQWLSCGAP